MTTLLELAAHLSGADLHLHPDVRDLLHDPGPWRARVNAQLYDGAGPGAAWLRSLAGATPDEEWEAYAGDLRLAYAAAPAGVVLERRGVFQTTSRFTTAAGELVETAGAATIRWRVAADRGALVLTADDVSAIIAPHPHHLRCVLWTAKVHAGGRDAGGLRIALHDPRARSRPVRIPEGRPLRVAVLGGGLAGLAAANALTGSVREYNRRFAGARPPLEMELDLFHLGRELGGKVQSVPVDVPDASMNPRQPVRFHMTHGLHFVWGYPHFRDLLGPDLIARTLSPRRGTSSYVTWLSDKDTIDGKSRLTVLNVCDPARPEDARIPECRTFLRLMRHAPKHLLELIETFMRVDVREFLHFGDILFNRRELSAVARWLLLFGAIEGRSIRDPEHGIIPGVRGPLKDKEYLEAIGTARREWLVLLREELDDFLDAIRAHLARPALGSLGDLAGRTGRALRAWSTLALRLPAGVSLVELVALVRLLVSDLIDLARDVESLDLERYAYLRVPLDAAFSSPYALDAATAIRDAKFGTRSYKDSLVQVFDGDDPRLVCDELAARFEGKRDAVEARVVRLSPVQALRREPTGELAVRVWPALTKHPATWRPVVHPYAHHHGAPPEPNERIVDVVISTLPPANLAWVLDASALEPDTSGLRAAAAAVGRTTNETLNLQVFFRERIELPFPDYAPPGADPPFCISGIEGPFTILADLRRAFSPARFREIRIEPGDGDFDGTAWDLVGSYGELFSHNRFLQAARQWPSGVKDELLRLLHDPADFDARGRDERAWAYDWEPGRRPPVLGEVLAERSAAYGEKWRNRAAPLIVATALRQLLELPGWAPGERAKLEQAIASGRYWWALARNCHEHNRFISTEPGLADHRPHARFETRVENVYVAGDWTRNGSNLICMDATVASGLHASAAVLERLAGTRGEWRDLVLPRFHPDCVPGGWDESP